MSLVVLIVTPKIQDLSQHIVYFEKYKQYYTQDVDSYLLDNIIYLHTSIRAATHNYKSIKLNFDSPGSHRSRPHAL